MMRPLRGVNTVCRRARLGGAALAAAAGAVDRMTDPRARCEPS
jgi:hypothetical protein